MKKLKILIVEDDKISEMLLTMAVESYGRVILKAGSGNEALDVCQSESEIDLILMDISMPGMNGYEATKNIREFNKDVIIIAQTAFEQYEFESKALSAGCNDYITKPVSPFRLANLLSKYFLNLAIA